MTEVVFSLSIFLNQFDFWICLCLNIWDPQIVTYVCVLALYVAWLRNYMQSDTVNIVIKDVDFDR